MRNEVWLEGDRDGLLHIVSLLAGLSTSTIYIYLLNTNYNV